MLSTAGDKLESYQMQDNERKSLEFVHHVQSCWLSVLLRAYVLCAHRLVNGHASSSCRTVAEWHSEFTTLLAAGNKLAALELPGPSNGVVQCYVQRTAGLLGMAPNFELRVEASDELLAVARKRKKSTSSSYLISMEGDGASIKRGDEQLVAKVSGCMMSAACQTTQCVMTHHLR